MSAHSVEQLKKWFKDHYDETIKDFFTFLSFPSISTDPKYEQDSRRTAEWLCEYMNQIGLDTTLWETPGLPVVFGTHLKAGPHRPTLLIYHHYDVQPVDPLDLWKSDPFNPVIKNNQVYARGAVDNKGQCFYSLTALKAFLQLVDQFDFNIKGSSKEKKNRVDGEQLRSCSKKRPSSKPIICSSSILIFPMPQLQRLLWGCVDLSPSILNARTLRLISIRACMEESP